MENKQSAYNLFIKPVIVLIIITAIVAVGLAFTNEMTAPIIAANTKKEADLSRSAVLDKADSFTLVTLDAATMEKTGATEAYKADNGTGFVVTTVTSGYSGEFPVMVGFDATGAITKIKIMANQETAGIGKKVETDAFTDQFSAAVPTDVKDKVTTISGATISSKAVLKAVDGAFAVVAQLKGGK